MVSTRGNENLARYVSQSDTVPLRAIINGQFVINNIAIVNKRNFIIFAWKNAAARFIDEPPFDASFYTGEACIIPGNGG